MMMIYHMMNQKTQNMREFGGQRVRGSMIEGVVGVVRSGWSQEATLRVVFWRSCLVFQSISSMQALASSRLS